MFLSCAMYTLSSHLVNYIQLSEVVQLCNAFIKYETDFTSQHINTKATPRKTTSKDLLLKYMIYLLTCTGMPIVYHLDVFRNPCYTLYVNYWMSDLCQLDKPGQHLKATWSLMEIGTIFGISLFSYLNWSLLLVGCNFQTSLEYIMEGQCFRAYLAESGK